MLFKRHQVDKKNSNIWECNCYMF